MLYLIYAESVNYCGYGQHFVTEALSEDHAKEKVEGAVEEYFFEQDQDQILEEYGPDYDECYGTIISVEPFDPTHESWKFYKDPTQSEFYIKV